MGRLRLLLRLGCRGLLGCWLRGGGLRWAGPFHSLQLPQSLAIERGVGRLRDAILIRRRRRFRRLNGLLRIGRKIEKRHILLLEVVTRVHYPNSVAGRPIEEEPEEEQVSDEGDPKSFAAASAGAFVLKPVNEVKEFIRFQLLVAHALTFGERLRWAAGRAGWNFG
jgi:hypothetical protein